MRLLIFISFCFILACPSRVSAEEYITRHIPDAEAVGEGRLSFLFWDVYDVKLHAPDGVWEEKPPYAMSFSYLRKVTSEQIAETGIEEMENQGVEDQDKLSRWHADMLRIFPDVDDGITLTGIYKKNGESVFYKNGEKIARVKDPEFGKAFFDIWLSEKTSRPGLRKKLIGANE